MVAGPEPRDLQGVVQDVRTLQVSRLTVKLLPAGSPRPRQGACAHDAVEDDRIQGRPRGDPGGRTEFPGGPPRPAELRPRKMRPRPRARATDVRRQISLTRQGSPEKATGSACEPVVHAWHELGVQGYLEIGRADRNPFDDESDGLFQSDRITS